MTQTLLTSGDSSAPMSFTGGDDNTLAIKVGAAGSKVNAVVFAADGTPTFLKVPVNTALQSMVRLNTANGYGSTNTMIRRFTNVVTNQGSDITYADSATLGATFTVNTSGVYAISYTDTFTAAAHFGLTLNSSQLTTAFYSTTVSDRLSGAVSPGSNLAGAIQCTAYLATGSVVRAHTEAVATGGAQVALFTITRVA
jgi:hypothetical protein